MENVREEDVDVDIDNITAGLTDMDTNKENVNGDMDEQGKENIKMTTVEMPTAPTGAQLEKISLAVSKYMKSKVPPNAMETYFTNACSLRDQHMQRYEVFENLYKWKPPAEGRSIASVFDYGGDIRLTPYNTVTIENMAERPGHVFQDKYLLCRTVAPPLKMYAVHLVVQDINDLGARVILTGVANLAPYHPTIIPIGSILLFKDPSFHFTADTEIGYSLLVTKSSSVRWLDRIDFSGLGPKHHVCDKCRSVKRGGSCTTWGKVKITFAEDERVVEFLRLPREWKRAGDGYMEDEDYERAVWFYGRGLKLTPKDGKLLLHRAEAFLKMGSFDRALGDAEGALAGDPKNLKGILLKGKALMGLGRYLDAFNYLKAKLKIVNQSKEVEFGEALETAKALYNQHKSGTYDMVAILKTMTQRQELAPYTGPIGPKPGADEGVVTTKAVKRGQLLLAQKAFVSCVGEDCADWPVGNLTSPDVVARSVLLHNVEYLLTCFPEKSREFYATMPTPQGSQDHEPLDTERMTGVIFKKAFGGIPGYHPSSAMQNTGIFPGLPSRLKHSCMGANCSWHLFGDFLMVRAYVDIAPGEDLTIAAVDPKMTYGTRLKKMAQLGLTCDCALCKLDGAEELAVRQERERLFLELQGLLAEPYVQGPLAEKMKLPCVEVPLAELDGKLSRLMDLRKGAPELNVQILGLSDAIAKAYFSDGAKEKALSFLQGMLPALRASTCTMDYAGCMLGIAACYNGLGDKGKVKEWLGVLRGELEVILGGPGARIIEVLMTARVFKKYRMVGIGL